MKKLSEKNYALAKTNRRTRDLTSVTAHDEQYLFRVSAVSANTSR